MSFVQLGGEAGGKPTYFEVYAADALISSLRAAVVYALSVFGQQRAWVQRLLNYENEVFALVCLLLDGQSLRNLDATFAESLYGLKRQHCPPGAAAAAAAAVGGQEARQQQAGAAGWQQQVGAVSNGRLTARQRNLALLCQVLLPYLKAKADKLYGDTAPRSILGLAVTRAAAQQQQQAATLSPHQQRLAELRRWALAGFLRAYPFLHAGVEAASFAYQFMFLLDLCEYHSPVLQLLGQRMVRMSGPEMALIEGEKQQHRRQQWERAGQHPSWLGRTLSSGWLHLAHFVNDHTRTVIIASVFGFKVLEWWFTSAEERLAAGEALPPPPAPKAPTPDASGVPLPADVSLCPLCRRKRTNPAVVAVSGYAFCYPCIFSYVLEHHCCPVTRIYATLEHIRKLYEAM